MRHDPTLCSTGRHGSWATCSCGWRSDTYQGLTGAHLAFGRHLADVNASPEPSEAPRSDEQPLGGVTGPLDDDGALRDGLRGWGE